MKIDAIVARHRTKNFEIQAGRTEYVFPFALLRLRPAPGNRVTEVFPDEDIGREGFTYRLADGSEDTVLMDAVLEYNQDPDHLRVLLLHRLTIEAREAVKASEISKRELIRRLGTSASQLYRLLDPTNTGKSIGQMLALLHLLGRDVDLMVTRRGG